MTVSHRNAIPHKKLHIIEPWIITAHYCFRWCFSKPEFTACFPLSKSYNPIDHYIRITCQAWILLKIFSPQRVTEICLTPHILQGVKETKPSNPVVLVRILILYLPYCILLHKYVLQVFWVICYCKEARWLNTV